MAPERFQSVSLRKGVSDELNIIKSMGGYRTLSDTIQDMEEQYLKNHPHIRAAIEAFRVHHVEDNIETAKVESLKSHKRVRGPNGPMVLSGITRGTCSCAAPEPVLEMSPQGYLATCQSCKQLMTRTQIRAFFEEFSVVS